MSSATSFQDEAADRKEIIEKIIAYATKSVAKDELRLITPFIRQYYSYVPIEDLLSRDIKNHFGTVLSHWKLLRTRKPHESKIRVYNPVDEQEGWHSPHTIVEVIHDDLPFLAESIRMEINRLGYTIHLIIHFGGMKVVRNELGQITEIFPPESEVKDAAVEAPIYLEIDKQLEPDVLVQIAENLHRILHDVRLTVKDWSAMCQRVQIILSNLDEEQPPLDPQDLTESKTFLKWLINDHFTFLGSREYSVIEIDGKKALQLIPNTGLGVLQDEFRSKVIRYFDELPPKARKQALSKQMLILSKTNTTSTVHRPTYTDYIGVKRFDAQGEIVGFTLFIGLYTSDAYNSKLCDIPLIRRKVKDIIYRSGLSNSGHVLKTLLNILDTFPRDDVFQGNVETLCDIAVGIFQLQDRKRIRLFVLPDIYDRYLSCLVYVPRENLSTDLIDSMQEALMNAFDGFKVSYTTYFPESVLARIHYVIRVNPKKKPTYDIKAIENELVEIGRSWTDGLQEEIKSYSGEDSPKLISKYIKAFPAGYREIYYPKKAVYDIQHLEKLSPDHDLELSIYIPSDSKQGNLRFKLYRFNNLIPLSDVLPILENMGLRVIGEQPYQINLGKDNCAWINDFNMSYHTDHELQVEEIKEIFQDAFYSIWKGFAENDGFNKLVLGAKLAWWEISVLRAYAKYLRQIGFTFSQNYIEETFANNPTVARLLMDVFNHTFDPKAKNKLEQLAFIEEKLLKELDEVANLDEDKILRRYLEVMKGTLRTNYFQRTENNEFKSYISFKINPSQISDIPLPVPLYETFVYSTDFEGVHLRAGKVARGGLRWSNRREDFRTEILGLMKAQQVKNAIIVPSGAKGGFVIKNMPVETSHETLMELGIYCYKNFIRGLLDLSDNIVGNQIESPADTVCFDDDDPYLVVAADKGTATFSDTANVIAAEYQFWLDDAFASGGSAGYDHKKMGITARGAWESVKSHFRVLNIDPYYDNFTVVGVGDMAGDVFGNGMLYTDRIKLVAAFNHMHIFIDPNPDPKSSYFERLRLFKLPSSTWLDYDSEIISTGGGVYSRSAKSIKLSPEAKIALGTDKEVVTPNELMRIILKAPVDLFWNGGIGTFVKATTESHSEIGDRANDPVRINGNELRCQVVAEGGNLGFTQLGRIEFELSGGKINTDFIDNSAGVDCSDHEVNIKILLSQLIAKKVLDEKQRNKLLSKMTDEVAQLVLYDNYCQTRAISFAVNNSFEYLELYRQFMQSHERNGNLSRSLEFLPDDQTLNDRKASRKGLTRPEIAVLMAYSKNILKKELLISNLTENEALNEYLETAFPSMLRGLYPELMAQHYLRREIIATQVSNRLVTEMGATFVYQMNDENNSSSEEIVRAYLVARKIFNLNSLWIDVESLDNKIAVEVQDELMLDVMRLGRRTTRWFLLNKRKGLDVNKAVNHFSTNLEQLKEIIPDLISGEEKKNYKNLILHYIANDVPEDIAKRVALTRPLLSSLNIIEAASANNKDILEVAKTYFKLMERLELTWFREKINDYPVDNHWAVLARADYKGDLHSLQRALTVSVLKMPTVSRTIEERVDEWLGVNKKYVARWKSVLSHLRSANTNEFAMLTVAMRGLLELAQSSRHSGHTADYSQVEEFNLYK